MNSAGVENVKADTGVSARKPKPLDFDPSVYLRNDYVVLDFETTNKDHGNPANPSNELVLACWLEGSTGLAQYQIQSHFGGEYDQERMVEAIQRASFVVAYHAKFELGWLRRCGVELRDLIVYDPMLGEYVLYGNIKPRGGYGLDASLERWGIPGKMRYVSELIAAGVCPSTIPTGELQRYCERDVRRTHDLFLRQRRRVVAEGKQRVLYGRCLQSPMLADIESRGVQVDADRVRVDHVDTFREYNRLDGELQAFTGVINWRSPKQVGSLLYDKLAFSEPKDHSGNIIKTPAGARATAEGVVASLKPRTEEQHKFQALWSVLAGLRRQTQILESLRGACDEDMGRIWASFNQAVTQNHRLSSSGGKWGLQFQNFPRDFKPLFRARERGWAIVEGDCPQLEFRVAVELAGDTVGLADVLARADIHSLTSAITGFTRQEAKPHTFKPLYGGRSGPPRLRKYYDAFRRRYNRVYDTQMGWVYTVLESKQLTIPTGLVFSWPDTEVTSSGYITNTPSIFNYPISSFATADISQLSLCILWHHLRGLNSFIVNTIHDSGILEVLKEELDIVRRLMVQSYTIDIYDALDKLYNYDFRCPLGVGIKCGEYWGEGEEEKHESSRFEFTSDSPTRIVLQ